MITQDYCRRLTTQPTQPLLSLSPRANRGSTQDPHVYCKIPAPSGNDVKHSPKTEIEPFYVFSPRSRILRNVIGGRAADRGRGLSRHCRSVLVIVAFAMLTAAMADAESLPNIILVMADDQGWGQTSYYNHPILKTPNLDAMASAGLRFDRFYAGAPVCSPTRGSVLTGRSNDRIGVESHGYALRRQEITIASILKDAGYVTGHFGKWHLNAMRGPGVPILNTDTHHPGHFGFDDWLSVTNFFDRDPVLSRRGKFEEFQGDSSEIVVAEALDFMTRQVRAEERFFAVIWYGTPHSPFKASEADSEPFKDLDQQSKHHYGELVAMDRSIGALRTGLRKLKLADNTLVWFCSDNGGLPKIQPETVGGLRGNKGTIYEGGLRVPGIIEWPAGIKPRITNYPASVLDIVPTLLDVVGIKHPTPARPLDGISLLPLFTENLTQREKPIPFRHTGKAAIIDNRYKLLTTKLGSGKFELYDLIDDPAETNNVFAEKPELSNRLVGELLEWNQSVDRSFAGKEYPAGRVDPSHPSPRFWTEVEAYQPYFPEWKNRWEYASRLNPRPKKTKQND